MPPVNIPSKSLKPAKKVSIPKPNTSANSAKKGKEEREKAPVKLHAKFGPTPKQVTSRSDLALKRYCIFFVNGFGCEKTCLYSLSL